ncbi:MAG TPA: CaiB/BaiF CoA-transferase family protein [Vicinamibacterales bacterium]|nr:CaiB/BaiF CoA-transferase family protein [Vicinamibacterales bacterium]
MPPLDGITVVAIEQAVAAPFATRQLADLGARVIKIERPDGGDFARGYDGAVKGLSSYFVWLNRSKESLTLDLKRSEGMGVLSTLLAKADVFVQNLAPGAAERLGTSAAALCEQHPSLIACNISGYGTAGPYADKKAYDLLVQAETGLVSITGTEESACKVGISVADIAAGMYAYSGILTALFARTSTGRGTSLDVSLFDALGEWMGAPMYHDAYAEPLKRSGANHASIAPYGPFRAGDGGQIVLAIQNAREWRRFCAEVLERAELADDDRFATNALRVRNRNALHLAMESILGTLSSRDLIAKLEAARIAYGRVNDVRGFVAHPQLVERDCCREIGSPNGAVRAILPPIRMQGVAPAMGPVPALGEHTDAILAELGIDRETMAVWRREGVI